MLRDIGSPVVVNQGGAARNYSPNKNPNHIMKLPGFRELAKRLTVWWGGWAFTHMDGMLKHKTVATADRLATPGVWTLQAEVDVAIVS